VKTAKIFQHGNSQAVRLPKEFRFEEDEVVIKRHAGGVLLLPKRYAFDDLLEILQRFEGPIERGRNAPPQKRKF
jgi:antitoxin VapB